ncbi:MAG: hypothetical protein D8M59_11330 [Planctomycetes bacterium]|nr:hypothetical protein [Planctomycetota bacterium]NOG54055.1 hypothetical protein [Planctomycetota bacterium]
MLDFDEVARSLLELADLLIQQHAPARMLASVDSLPDKCSIPADSILIARNEVDHERATDLLDGVSGACVLDVPGVKLDRTGQVNLAILLAMSQHVLAKGDSAVFLVGEQGKLIDTLHMMTIGDQLNLAGVIDDGVADPKHVRRAVFQRTVNIALTLAAEGREGKPIGAFFVIGDSVRVAEHTEQLIINPFRGYPEDMRNILDTSLNETVKEFSSIDGAFVIRGDGVIESAGTLIRASLVDEDLPKGLGARHAAAAGITTVTDAIAITISESDGTVRVWRSGKIISSFEHG